MVRLAFLGVDSAFWCIDGVLKDARPLWIINSLMLTMILVMIGLKTAYRHNIPDQRA
ncbi:hypothetical protein ABDD95_18910 [Mucilaginibacter sp. PAMB04274]|uniref:hypothetical protein n=1 Tax=Mucilaginibacter sp. PAMB04274 TaxID=3138568 RepID=UPI0031F70D72